MVSTVGSAGLRAEPEPSGEPAWCRSLRQDETLVAERNLTSAAARSAASGTVSPRTLANDA